MSRQPSLNTVLEGFLQKEIGTITTIDEDVVAVGSNDMYHNRSCHQLAIQQQEDLKALCTSFHSLQLLDYMEQLINFFYGDQSICGISCCSVCPIIVPDMRSRDHEVVVVRRTINLGTGNLEWGGVEEGEVSLQVT
jgi:hypothetical protein